MTKWFNKLLSTCCGAAALLVFISTLLLALIFDQAFIIACIGVICVISFTAGFKSYQPKEVKTIKLLLAKRDIY